MHRIAGIAAVALLMAGAALADTRQYDFSGFTRVEAAEGLEVEIEPGDGFEISAEGSGRALRRLKVSQSGDTLILGRDFSVIEWLSPFVLLRDDPVRLHIVLPRLDGVGATSGCEVTVTGGYAGDFGVEASSGAGVDLAGIGAERVRLAASSGAAIAAAGQCGSLVAEVSSGARLDAGNMVCDSAEAEASSGATAVLSAAAVRASASSGGRIDVHGVDDLEAEASSGGVVARHD